MYTPEDNVEIAYLSNFSYENPFSETPINRKLINA